VTPADRAPTLPEVPPFHGEWSGANSPLEHSPPVAAGVHWASAGRRITLVGSAVGGLEAATADTLRLESGPLVFPTGAALEALSLHATPSEVWRVFRETEQRCEERWLSALDHGVAFRELDVPDSVAFEQTWNVRAAGSTLAATVDPDGRVAIVAAQAAGPRILLALDNGRIESAEAEPGAAGLRVSGRGRVRLMVVAGADGVDLERGLQAVARRGFTGLRAQRLQHERLLREYGSGLSTPSERLDTAFEWARVRADEMVRADRSVTAAEALLAVGSRDGARELLKAGCPALAAAWTAWTGEQAPGADRAGSLAPTAASRSSEQVVSAADPALESADGAADLPPDLLLSWVTGSLWGIVADAPRGAVSLAPRLPPGWTRMALSRIRVGGSAIDCAIRAREGGLTARVRRVSGPPLTVTLVAPGTAAQGISVDGIELAGGRARFDAVGEHEVIFGPAS